LHFLLSNFWNEISSFLFGWNEVLFCVIFLKFSAFVIFWQAEAAATGNSVLDYNAAFISDNKLPCLT